MNSTLSKTNALNKVFIPGKRLYKIGAITLLLSSCFMPCFSQSAGKGQIIGIVIDSATRKPVDFATISLFKPGSVSPVTGISTNNKGEFTLTDITDGVYRLTADFLGYQIKTIDKIVIGTKARNVYLGNILLVPVQNNLKEVVIRSNAAIVENKIDKLVYNPAADLTSQGGMATDVLAKVPMVAVDIDGNITLQGNANIRFLVNGKPASSYGANITDALQTIPASEIQRIEVITSPGAKYDAEGTAGIINIVLKENKTKGINGGVNISAGTRLENGSANLNVRDNHIGIGAFFSGNDQLNSDIINTANRLSYNAAKDTMTQYIQKRRSPFARNGYQSGLNFDWNITPRDAFTASVGYNHVITHATGNTAQDQRTFLSSGVTLEDIMSERVSATHYGENAFNWSLGYKKNFKVEGRELDVMYAASYSKNSNYDSEVTHYLNGGFPAGGIQSNNPGNDHETDISIDYTEPLSNGFKIETGAKAVLENIRNNVATDTLLTNGNFVGDAGQSYRFNFTRNIYAGYLSADFSLFKDFLSGKTGIRYERTDTKSGISNIIIPTGDIWATSLLLQHKLNESQSIKFAFTYRIERPGYEDLDPFLDIIDPHNINTGNPLTKNETGHKFELGYSKSFANNSNIYIAGFYNYNNNDIQEFTTYYPVYTANSATYYDVSVSKTTNIGSQTTVGLNLSGTAVITSKFRVRSNIFLLDKNNLMAGQPSVGGFSYQANLNATYNFKNDLIAEAFGTVNSKRTDFQNVRPGSYFYSFAIKKQFLNRKASFGFTTTNPFNKYINQYSSAYGAGFTQVNMRQKTLRSFGFTLSYKFGSLKVKEKEVDEDNAPAEAK